MARNLVRRTIFQINNRDTEPRDLVLYCQPPADENETISPAPQSSDHERARFEIDAAAKSMAGDGACAAFEPVSTLGH